MTHPKNTDHAAPDADLRDARLTQALKHMPDAHMQPGAQTRHAVLQAALRAASASSVNTPGPTPPTKRRRWNTWLGQPDQRVPWSAALASVALMGFITVLWYEQDVPQVTSESSPVTQWGGATQKGAAPVAPMGADTAAMRSAAPDKERTSPAEVVTQTSNRAEPPSAALSAAAPKQEMAPSPAPSAPPAAPAAADVSASADENAKEMGDAAPQRLSRADATTHAAKKMRDKSTAPPVLTIVMGDVKRSIAPEQAQNLLKLLRELSIGPSSDLPTRSDTQADFMVDLGGRERWLIWPGSVSHQIAEVHAKDGPAEMPTIASRCDITPTQYDALRRLVMEATLSPLQ